MLNLPEPDPSKELPLLSLATWPEFSSSIKKALRDIKQVSVQEKLYKYQPTMARGAIRYFRAFHFLGIWLEDEGIKPFRVELNGTTYLVVETPSGRRIRITFATGTVLKVGNAFVATLNPKGINTRRYSKVNQGQMGIVFDDFDDDEDIENEALAEESEQMPTVTIILGRQTKDGRANDFAAWATILVKEQNNGTGRNWHCPEASELIAAPEDSADDLPSIANSRTDISDPDTFIVEEHSQLDTGETKGDTQEGDVPS